MALTTTITKRIRRLYEKHRPDARDYSKPSTETIRVRLTQSKWSAQGKISQSYSFSSSFAKKSETGKTGLVNLGNTCYMNSVIQALYMCDSFRREALQSPITHQQVLLLKFQLLVAHLSMTQRAAYSPTNFLKVSRPSWFTQGHQQDCSEFLKYLLDQFHEQEIAYQKRIQKSDSSNGGSSSPKRTKPQLEPTLIQRTFGGELSTTYQCLNCGNASNLTEAFTDLPLAFPSLDGKRESGKNGKATLNGGSSSSANNSTLQASGKSTNSLSLDDMLDYFLKPEILHGDNRYECDSCGSLQDAERSLHITHAPEYLIFTLLRFSYNIKTQSRSKIFTDVKCPKTIRIPVGKDDSLAHQGSAGRSKFYSNQASPKMETYCLCSVIIHSGTSSECGHYYCYARHSSPLNNVSETSENNGEVTEDYLEDKWYLFNDSRVTYSSYNSFSSVAQKFARDTVYIPVYKRIPEEPQVTKMCETPLRKDLREAVEKDNMFFLQEQELEARAKAMQKGSNNVAATSYWYGGWKDDDGNGPPGSCSGGGGGGGLGHLDTSGSRFIF